MAPTQLLRHRTFAVTGAIAVVLGAVGAGGAVLVHGAGRPSVSAAGADGAGDGGHPAPPVRVSVAGLRHGAVHYGHPVTLTARDGRIAGVSVSDGTGHQLGGALATGGTTWRSARILPPDMDYRAVVQTVAGDGSEGTLRLHFRSTTIGRDDVLTATVSPDGGTFGVGMPVVAYFDHDVPTPFRATVEHRFTVRSSSKQVGAWHWMDARTAHWRPARLWRAHASVAVRWNLDGINLGHGVWGDRATHRASFRVGDSHVSTVDATAHFMAVRVNGRTVRVMPVSTGRPEYASKGGPHIVLSKQRQVIMDSATVGIPKGDPDYYYEKVYWDTRISNGGMFVHAAPWSERSQGAANVSHGCVNVSTTDAEWFYYFSQVGDVVNVIHTPARPLLWDPGTADWTISWRTWLAGDPAHPKLPRSIPTDPALLAGVSVSAPPPPPATTPPPTTTPPTTTPPATHRPEPKPKPTTTTTRPATTTSPTPTPTPTRTRH